MSEVRAINKELWGPSTVPNREQVSSCLRKTTQKIIRLFGGLSSARAFFQAFQEQAKGERSNAKDVREYRAAIRKLEGEIDNLRNEITFSETNPFLKTQLQDKCKLLRMYNSGFKKVQQDSRQTGRMVERMNSVLRTFFQRMRDQQG